MHNKINPDTSKGHQGLFLSVVAGVLGLNILKNTGLKAHYSQNFSEWYPKSHGVDFRLDDGTPLGVGFELFLGYGGGFWFYNEQGGGWKSVNFGYNSLAELSAGVAEQVKNSQWVNLESLYLGDSTDPWVVIKNHFESEFQKSNNYSFVTVGTSAGAEAGCIMFKHTSSTINYGLMFSRRVGVCCLQRDSSATWFVKEVLSV